MNDDACWICQICFINPGQIFSYKNSTTIEYVMPYRTVGKCRSCAATRCRGHAFLSAMGTLTTGQCDDCANFIIETDYVSLDSIYFEIVESLSDHIHNVLDERNTIELHHESTKKALARVANEWHNRKEIKEMQTLALRPKSHAIRHPGANKFSLMIVGYYIGMDLANIVTQYVGMIPARYTAGSFPVWALAGYAGEDIAKRYCSPMDFQLSQSFQKILKDPVANERLNKTYILPQMRCVSATYMSEQEARRLELQAAGRSLTDEFGNFNYPGYEKVYDPNAPKPTTTKKAPTPGVKIELVPGEYMANGKAEMDQDDQAASKPNGKAEMDQDDQVVSKPNGKAEMDQDDQDVSKPNGKAEMDQDDQAASYSSVIPADIASRLNDTDAHTILLTLPAPERLAKTVEFAYYADYAIYAKFADNAVEFDELDSNLPQARDHLGISHKTIMTAHHSGVNTAHAFIAEIAKYAVYATNSEFAEIACDPLSDADEIVSD